MSVKQSTLDFAETFKQHSEVDSKTGEIKIKESLFPAALEQAELDEATYKKVSELNGNLAAGFGYFLGQEGNSIFKENKDIDTISASFTTIGRDGFKGTYDRQAQYTNPKTNEKVTQFGILNVQHNVTATRKGQYGAVKQLLKQQAAEAYGNK